MSYIHYDNIHNLNAANEILPFLMKRFAPKSLLDVGCGTGTWLKVAQELGISEIQGIDGDYVPKEALKISEFFFKGIDLRSSFDLGKKFDLVLSLEVAEHLPEASADAFISSLCKHSDIIVFSAAIPNQGGQNHINEQWPSYWMEKFKTNGYLSHDILRFQFWDNPRVDFWYKQNMFVFIKSKSQITVSESDLDKPLTIPVRIVHPELLQHLANEIKFLKTKLTDQSQRIGVKKSLRLFVYEVVARLKRK